MVFLLRVGFSRAVPKSWNPQPCTKSWNSGSVCRTLVLSRSRPGPRPRPRSRERHDAKRVFPWLVFRKWKRSVYAMSRKHVRIGFGINELHKLCSGNFLFIWGDFMYFVSHRNVRKPEWRMFRVSNRVCELRDWINRVYRV